MADVGIDEDIVENEEIEDNSIYTIEKHEKSVFCIDLYNNYLASGGEDDIAYIWLLNNNEESQQQAMLYYETEKFKDSIINVRFSTDGKYLAVADMCGTIRVYDVDKKQMHWSHDLELDVEIVLWHFGCNVLFVGTDDSYLWMLKLSTNEVKTMGVGESGVKVNNALILKDGKRAVCAYSNGTLTVWDLKTAQVTHNFKELHDKNEIVSLDLNREGTIMACGGFAMKLTIVNTSNYKIVSDVDLSSECKPENCIETLSFCPLMPLLAFATIHGEIFVWDLQTNNMRNKLCNDFDFGFTKCLWSKCSFGLYFSALNGCIYEFDGRNLAESRKFQGHLADVLDMCLSDDQKYLFTASDDHKIKIFQLFE
jgi:WD40 repeat protein